MNDEWNAAIEAVHALVDEAAGGRGPLWEPVDMDDAPDAGMVLDRLPNAIWALRRTQLLRPGDDFAGPDVSF